MSLYFLFVFIFYKLIQQKKKKKAFLFELVILEIESLGRL